MLALHVLDRLNRRYPELHKHISNDSLRLLQAYPWPGNVRELENVLERVFSLVDAPVLLPEHLEGFISRGPVGLGRLPDKPLKKSLAEIERELILEALAATGGNRTRAARLLGIPRSSFYQKIKAFSLAD